MVRDGACRCVQVRACTVQAGISGKVSVWVSVWVRVSFMLTADAVATAHCDSRTALQAR